MSQLYARRAPPGERTSTGQDDRDEGVMAADAKLTYGNKGPLDGPVVLIGGGAASLLAATIGTLTFDNDTAGGATTSILAARDATP